MKIERNIPIPTKESEDRAKFIKDFIRSSQVGESSEFETDNISAWRVALGGYVKSFNENRVINAEFTTKRIDDNKYRIWRKA